MSSGGFRPNSGRKQGIPNKRRDDILILIQSDPLTADYDPLLSLAICAQGVSHKEVTVYRLITEQLDKTIVPEAERLDRIRDIIEERLLRPIADFKTLVKAHSELIQYLYPKLRSVELSDPNGGNPFAAFLAAVKTVPLDPVEEELLHDKDNE